LLTAESISASRVAFFITFDNNTKIDVFSQRVREGIFCFHKVKAENASL